PASLPEDIKEHLDLSSGDDRGRVYRLEPPRWQQRAWPNLAKMSTAELVKQLGSPNAWQRETAQRLLFESGDASVAADIRWALATSMSATGKLHLLGALQGVGALTGGDLIPLLHDGD